MHKTVLDLNTLGMIRVASAVPLVIVGDCYKNSDTIIAMTKEASENGASLIVFPELSITSYTLGDLVQQEILLDTATKCLGEIAQSTQSLDITIIVGLPLRFESKLFNVAAVISRGIVKGIIPKINLPEYKEFYDKRWFASGRDLIGTTISLFGYDIPIGSDLLFKDLNSQNNILGVEICEDVWTPLPPSSAQAVAGATLLANLSASNELVGKANYRRNLIIQQSARTIAAYIYTSSGIGESTTDTVFSGHSLIAENGTLVKESSRYNRTHTITYADLDIAHCVTDRIRTTSFGDATREISGKAWRTILLDTLSGKRVNAFEKSISQSAFIPKTDEAKQEIAEEVFNIQVSGLVKRMEQSGIRKLVLGLSGGLDSTLAFLVGMKSLELLGLPKEHMHVFTMPGLGTTEHTKSNAYLLSKAFGVTLEEISIVEGVVQHFKDIKHDGKTEDTAYENTQARYRTMILMDKANQLGAFVLGTGDLSEIALGWNTFTGDHTAPYNVNTGVPKTLVKHVVEWIAKKQYSVETQEIIASILDTPISPELTSAKEGEIAQKTEEIVGPYELHDFFLYHFIRWSSDPKKILILAEVAFREKYSLEEIKKWLTIFIKRFFNSQWKRSIMPDGPKVGSVSLSPRADWRMPSDADIAVWIKTLE